MRRHTSCLVAFFVLGLCAAGPLEAGQKDIIDIVASPSSPGNVSPVSIGGGKRAVWIYPTFCTAGATSFVQDFPFTISLTNGNGKPGETKKFNITASGTLAPYATLPKSVTLTDDGTVVGPLTVSVNAASLAPGTYTLTIGPGAKAGHFNYVHASMSITVTIGPVCLGSVFSFQTDDQVDELFDCNGVAVGTATGGTFTIEPTGAGATTVKTTAPSPFYYNFIWQNTGASIDVELDLSSSQFTPSGADAVHALALPTSGFAADLATFQTVNTTGASCGTAGPCLVTVGSGQTLWATWAGTWSGVGGPTAGLPTSCPGDASTTIGISAVLKSGTSTIAASDSSSTGYLTSCFSADVNGDSQSDVLDVFYLINYLFAGGAAPTCGSGDVNADNVTDVLDVFYLINYLFAGGTPPL